MDEETLTVWLDTALLMLGGFVLMAILMLVILNPPAKSSEQVGMVPPGNVIIEAMWQDGLDADVDLWVRGPEDKPVGYSDKNGALFNLLRDDLGKARDVTDLNYEVSYTRGVVAGEYIANLHMYRGVGVHYPVVVRVVASVKKDGQSSPDQIAEATVQLTREGEERTALRFRIDSTGRLIAGTVNNMFVALRSAP